MTSMHQNLTKEEGTRVASLVYLIFAIFGMLANLALPLLLKSTSSHNNPQSLSGQIRNLDACCRHFKYQFSNAWASCEVLFAVCMLATFFVESWVGASVLITYCGVPWAMTQWAPFAILGEILSSSSEKDIFGEDCKGSILGLHNVAISAPQVPAALASSGIFWIARFLGSQDGGVWVLRAGAGVSIFAAYLASKLEV